MAILYSDLGEISKLEEMAHQALEGAEILEDKGLIVTHLCNLVRYKVDLKKGPRRKGF